MAFYSPLQTSQNLYKLEIKKKIKIKQKKIPWSLNLYRLKVFFNKIEN